MIPKDLVARLEEETKVNRQVKKMSGEIVLKLILFSLLERSQVSLRLMEEIYASEKFKIVSGKGNRMVKHNTIAERINHINPLFFEKIFDYLFSKFQPVIKSKSKFDLEIFDSTLVELSAKLLEEGMNCGGGRKKQIKFTFGFNGMFPTGVKIFREQTEVSEEVALRKAILARKSGQKSIVVFDRGLQRRKTFCDFATQNISFVARLKAKASYREVNVFKKVAGRKTKTLRLEKDLIVNLKDEQAKPIDQDFRLIAARSLETDEPILFLTNLTDLTAGQITDIYKRRWEIEVFFKFLKQELNFSHLVSRRENGIQVMLWVTLILALLLVVFKEKNQLAGYKIAKLRFSLELEAEIMKEIVLLCDGDVSKFFRVKNHYP
jgi:hypothetical protein